MRERVLLVPTGVHGLVVAKSTIDQAAVIFLFVFETELARVLSLQPFTGQFQPIIRFSFHGCVNDGIGNTFSPHCCPDFQWPLMALNA